MPARPVLDAETILSATEDVLRRYGPAKATVVDVARALGVTHASVYRHFPSKAALREAVTRRWLDRVFRDLAPVAADTRLAPPARLRAWLTALSATARRMTSGDPELFATYQVLVAEHWSTVTDHLAGVLEQLRGIIADGVASGDFAVRDPAAAAHVVFTATSAFHHPAHAAEWDTPKTSATLDDVCTLVLDGLRPR
ncbi:AcrR family transcriptional regulator [Amycolatopsis bartoniae]|uniref:TetR family transcriptional regulator n=1 Tax=Amycolatopsis bartoniae TaxID=941986 RepID=A0A8H9M4U6_9PSEU|nr:TetR family transcriptional regulator [Amycolatopsis bartoniae]MBB2936920.1 AcrR family transcriptional regulator [Amycolatopsis bartoniae]TVT01706.1 TetR/AcrR family transcriptional regulator [Amycolatopsis bartoniae]GHF51195.1 TetR family transcriptional regulator [Amycolatopsis bartoniae]